MRSTLRCSFETDDESGADEVPKPPTSRQEQHSKPVQQRRIAVAAPNGEATESEAEDGDLGMLGANAAIALGQFDDARQIAETLPSNPDAVLIEVEADIAEGIANDITRERLIAVLQDFNMPNQFRAYLQLADLGETEFPIFRRWGTKRKLRSSFRERTSWPAGSTTLFEG